MAKIFQALMLLQMHLATSDSNSCPLFGSFHG